MPEDVLPSRVVGVLGGMGPAATVDFYGKLVRATPAHRDQDHLRVVIWGDPTVPDRHEALLNGGEDPGPWLREGVDHLLRCGAEILVAPCNTIHAYLPAVVAGREVEFISIIDTTVEVVRGAGTGGRAGLLAADGALASNLYQSALHREGITTVLPSRESQRRLMEVIQAVKTDGAGDRERAAVASLVTQLADQGAATVIAGCTEISVLLRGLDVDAHVLDPSELLARRTVERARSAGRDRAVTGGRLPRPAPGSAHG